MGTNFYLGTKEKSVKDEYFGWHYEIVDEPDWMYAIHIAKTSCGWLPSFQAHECFKSIRELKKLYNTGLFTLFDEYGDVYNWSEFEDRVLKFNGGVKGVQERKEIKQDPDSMFYDPNLPKYLPISHFEYANGMYSYEYFTDQDGYEFTNHEFC